MLCETVREQLHTLSDGERLESRKSKVAVLLHCVSCSECRAFRQQMKRLRQTTRQLHNTLVVPASIRQRTLAQLFLVSENPVTVRASQTQIKKVTAREKEMKKRVAFATAALVIPVVAGTLAAQSRRTHPPLTPEQLAADQKHVDEVNAGLNDPQVAASFLKRTHELRETWKPWAMEHKQELSAMLDESGNKRAAFDRVQRLLPQALNHTKNAALTDSDLDAPGLPFAYMPQAIHLLPLSSANQQKEAQFAVRSAEADLLHYHDIEIICTMKSGNGYSLWASGRITERGNISMRRDEFREGIIRELAPPYPFLTE